MVTQDDGSDAADHDPPEPAEASHDAAARLKVHFHLAESVEEVFDAEYPPNEDELGDGRQQLWNSEANSKGGKLVVNPVELHSQYRVNLVVVKLGWVDFDLDVSPSRPIDQTILQTPSDQAESSW